jgi:twitching motility protein PilT
MNVFRQRGSVGAALRSVPSRFMTFEELGLPPAITEVLKLPRGLVLVTGPTGSGKSTTLASMIDKINESRPNHIITVEDPIEYLHFHKMSIVNQRELGHDTSTYTQALKYVLRQDPDVILIGEMRDQETIVTAMNAAETGHLVLGTLHTNDAKQAIDRIVDTFPPESQHQIRMQIAKCLNGVAAQRLIKRADNQGLVAIQEIMINTPTIQKLIEDNRISAISKAIEDSQSFYKMQSFNQALLTLIRNRMVQVDEALAFSNNPNDLRIQLQTEGLMEMNTEVPVGLMPPGLRGA